MLRPSRRRHHHGQGNDCDRVTGDLRGARREPQARARRSRSGIDRRTARRAAHGAENLTIPKTASARLVTTFSMTAYLGGASPVLQVRDSRLRWGVDTERGWVNVGGGGYVQRVLARYRYRAYPTPGQAAMLARTFGCARVVFNDALRARQDAHTSGEKISDTEVQRRVVTLAKTTPAREWLGEVASVALVQACQDARRAYRNWFDSLSGKRKGRKVGHPRFRSRKDNRQSIRLTRNGFGVTDGGVRVAKIGDVRLEWSRVLPCRRVWAVIREPAAGTTRRLWSRWQTHRYPRAPTM